jgi:hypothetical protein
MFRALIAAAALLASATTASAEAYDCRSLSGEPPATLSFTTRHSSGAYAVMAAEFQIEDDLGYSTTAAEPTSLATISGVEIDSENVMFRFHYSDAGYDGDVATVHVVTLSEGEHDLTAGVLQVSGGGLWAVQCEVDYAG